MAPRRLTPYGTRRALGGLQGNMGMSTGSSGRVRVRKPSMRANCAAKMASVPEEMTRPIPSVPAPDKHPG
ncbi:hypothetical protein MGYG_06138 [Nannizzia gypsea CBS 118893]|uniref:Uncharacterized protein n=1 Tax=Arthroderma gypseum (strain ATCC MYA-4604 / CBS 118893) TaxID=535722 RepID=E4V0K6_ARTGP|nr:hypothetical protein MGYG_06138 [Nannizzia gypsea CBS 118893]EFR03143.1 hypothetical protein MGYG_06138 [Nannizzia gypsea CBS 118893]